MQNSLYLQIMCNAYVLREVLPPYLKYWAMASISP